jgi:hypothetical protein
VELVGRVDEALDHNLLQGRHGGSYSGISSWHSLPFAIEANVEVFTPSSFSSETIVNYDIIGNSHPLHLDLLAQNIVPARGTVCLG